MIRIPLQPVPNQTFTVTLAGQSAKMALRYNGDALFFDLTVNETAIVLTKICRDRQRLLLDARYRGFVGDFAFVDTQGTDNPFYTGFGDAKARFQFYYIKATE